MPNLTMEEKYHLITRNLQEIIGGNRLKEILHERNLKIYWGTAPTGKPHIGYLIPMLKIADFLKAECTVTILIADLHAYLDMKTTLDQVQSRIIFYKLLIVSILESLDVPTDKLSFVVGTSFQLSHNYTLDAYKLFTKITEHDAKRAGSDVVKQIKNPVMSSLIYPGLQALDEEYLDVDAQFGGVDQRKIFVLAEKYLPAIGYAKRIHLMNKMVPGLSGSKMSSSDLKGKIEILDDPDTVTKKINSIFCEEGNVVNNGLLSFLENVLFSNIFPTFKNGDVIYSDFEKLKHDFANKLIHPKDFKQNVSIAINNIIAPIRQLYFSNENAHEIIQNAYSDCYASQNNTIP